MDPQLVADVKQAEGCDLTAYKDSEGYWTIGYGHYLPQNKDWTGYHITQDQAEQFLQDDLNTARTAAMTLPEWAFLNTSCRQNAVIELVFNMGKAKWRGFAKCRYDIQIQNWQAAHDELLASLWSHQVGPTRSNRLANYLLNGQYGS